MNIIIAANTFIKYLYLLSVSPKWDTDRILKYNYMMLKKSIYYAWEHVPFYRKFWEESGFSPQQFKDLDDMTRIPVIDRNVIINHLEDLVPDNVSRSRLSLCMSGGTTGMPMSFYIDKSIAHGKEFAFQLWGKFHYFGQRQFIDRVAIFRGHRISEKNLTKNIYWEQGKEYNTLFFSSFHILNENYSLYLNKIRSYKPSFIQAYPSSIVAFCSLMRDHGDFGIPSLKGVICSSENVYDWQRELVLNTLGVKIYSYYGHSEKCVCAFQGKEDRLFFPPLYGYTEFLDDDLNPVYKDGETAQVVVTGFDHDYFPLIRYKTYDYVEVENTLPYQGKIARRIIGRAQEFVYDKMENRIPFTCSDEVLWGIRGIIAYQYLQESVGVLILTLQVSDEFDMKSSDIIYERAKECFVNFEFYIRIVDCIERTKTGKFKYLIQSVRHT